jgi:hypothetical protein
MKRALSGGEDADEIDTLGPLIYDYAMFRAANVDDFRELPGEVSPARVPPTLPVGLNELKSVPISFFRRLRVTLCQRPSSGTHISSIQRGQACTKGTPCISVLAMVSKENSGSRTSLHCRNCGVYAPDLYCPHCGQETEEHPPAFWKFVHEFVLHYFAAEGRLWRTLDALVLHPGRLTIDYLRGRKLAYVLPLRLYLTVSILFFLLLKLVAAPGNERVISAFHHSLADPHTTFTIVDLGLARAVRNADGSFDCNLTEWFCNRIRERLLQQPGELESKYSQLPTELVNHLSTAVFLLLPLFALYLQLAYRKPTYGEHFLFALHVHSFWFLVLMAMIMPIPQWARMLFAGYLFAYTVMALHAVYRSAWWKTVLKGMVIGVAHIACLVVATTAFAVWTILK